MSKLRNLNLLESFRDLRSEIAFAGCRGDDKNGFFNIVQEEGPVLKVIASSGEGWDHVSVSTKTRTPTWEEMEKVRRLFFKNEATVVQFSVPEEEHVNCHEHCLHMWCPIGWEIDTPPKEHIA